MKSYLLTISVFFLVITVSSCQNKKNDYLIKVIDGTEDEIGAKTGYKNTQGDVVIPVGKYYYCFTDTLINYAIVLDKNQKCIAIDANDNFLYEVFWFDNGPDYISDGLFRIIKNGKIGYANEQGKIVIEPKYECANSFENGKAKVALNCEKTKMDEYAIENSNEWIYINKKGEVVKPSKEEAAKKEIVLTGRFRSIKGVMDNLSCYCYNSGYLTTKQGDNISICFEDDDLKIDCKKIKIKGYYKIIQNKPEKTNPCPSGEKEIFIVESYECQ